jgi:hypothetical protein
MYIILKNQNENTTVLDFFYTQNESIINSWIEDYINADIESLKMCPLRENEKAIVYEINKTDTNYQLIKRQKNIIKGYVYNTSEKFANVLYTISVSHFDSNTFLQNLPKNSHLENINSEINNRMLRRLDRDSILQVLFKINKAISSKDTWNKTDYINTVSDILKFFNKEKYSIIAKRMKRYD